MATASVKAAFIFRVQSYIFLAEKQNNWQYFCFPFVIFYIKASDALIT